MPSRSIVINAPAEEMWTTLKSFGGNEKFNPLVTSSRVDGYGAGAKYTCYVSVDGGKTVSETIEIDIITPLNDHDRTMTQRVANASKTPFEGRANKVTVTVLKEDDDMCIVEFTVNFDALNDTSRNELNKILQDTYASTAC